MALSANHLSTGLGASSALGARSFLTTTAAPLRSLKAPLLTTVSPAASPETTVTRSPRRSPRRTNFCRATSDGSPAPSFFSSSANTEKKEGAGEPSLVARQKFVRLGERRGDLVTVVSGLAAGETVVSSGAFKLRNGAAVVVRNDLAPNAELAPKPVDK